MKIFLATDPSPVRQEFYLHKTNVFTHTDKDTGERSVFFGAPSNVPSRMFYVLRTILAILNVSLRIQYKLFVLSVSRY